MDRITIRKIYIKTPKGIIKPKSDKCQHKFFRDYYKGYYCGRNAMIGSIYCYHCAQQIQKKSTF